MPNNTLQILPLTLELRDDRLSWSSNIDIPGVKFRSNGDGFAFSFEPRAMSAARGRKYSYAVWGPEGRDGLICYTSVYSGAEPATMERWLEAGGISISPPFDIAAGEYCCEILAVVAGVPGATNTKMMVNRAGPPQLSPSAWSLRSHAKTGGIGGDGDL